MLGARQVVDRQGSVTRDPDRASGGAAESCGSLAGIENN
jgi:hypothetical protein